jgi:addiction module RelE/StbE family toxin
VAEPKVEWRESARSDLLAIVDYISDDNPDAAQRLLTEIIDKASQLAEHPRLYQAGRVPGTREVLVHRNYIIVYAENERLITILRVLHAAQNWPR